MICSTLSGKLAIKHPVHGILCREDGWVFRHNTHKNGCPYEWTPGNKRKDGYYLIGLGTWVKGHSNQKLVHRLIAECFIPNTEHKPTVDHIDRNPSNNAVSNLRWATQHEQNINAKKHIERRQYSICSYEDKRAYGRLQSRDYYAKHREEILQRQKSRKDGLTGADLERYRQRRREYDKRRRNKLKSRRADGTSCQCPDSAEGSQSALQ